MPLPSKNIFIFVALAIVIIGIASVVAVGKQPSNKNPSPGNTALETSRPNTQDSDDDGLMDWEEALWNTDPNNPDTDGDGTSDGQEVAERRDPSKPGPDDDLPEKGADTNGSTTSTSTDATKTELFTREIFTRFLQNKQSGSLGSQNLAPVTGSLTQHFSQTSQTSSETYTREDLSVVYATSENIRSYGNTMGALFRKQMQTNLENELAIFGRAINTDSPQHLNKLDENISVYNTMIEEHLSVNVPEDAVDVHLAILQEYQTLTDTIKNMKVIFDDPLTAGLAVQTYNDHTDELEQAISDLQLYFLSRPVIFTEKEAGYIFEEE